MAWITLSLADVQSVVTSSEISTHTRLTKSASDAASVQPAIDQVTTLVRSRVQACARNTLGETGTIPDELREAALDLIAIRIPVGSEPDDGRSARAKAANDLLKDAARCLVAIVPPLTAAPQNQQAAQGGRLDVVRRGRIRRPTENLRGM